MANKQYLWLVLTLLVLIILIAGIYVWQNRLVGKTGENNLGGNLSTGQGNASDEINLRLVAQNLTSPLAVMPAGDQSGRLFIVDQIGQIRIIDINGNLLAQPFLDLKSKMVSLSVTYDERGLLGLAFHPDYKTNGRFFVYYSAPLRQGASAGWNHTSRISEFKVSMSDPNLAEESSEKIILQFDKPQANHNGGQIAFGPDGYLYIPVGDGGNANDTGLGHAAGGNAQDLNQLLGKILRLDINTSGAYAIPADNPFAAGGGRAEIYAYGLRNPFHIAFDAGGNRDLIAGDAGQNQWEEVDVVAKGGNYGWNIKEGRHCFDPESPDTSPASCSTQGKTLIDPVLEYKNINQGAGGIGAVVVGGYVYRGSEVPALAGKYIFGDWSKSFISSDGMILAADMAGNDWPFKEMKIAGKADGRLGEFLLGFGQDADNELYVLTKAHAGPSGNTGKIYKIELGQSQISVDIENFAFSPQSITVKAGTKIEWVNLDTAPHTATSEGKFDSGNLATGESFEITLSDKGVYNYICAYHPYMTGTIVVE